MTLLFDENLSYRLCARLNDLFPASVQVKRLGLERSDDRAIWSYAAAHGLAVVTRDADFAELAGHLGSPPKVLLLRIGNCSTGEIEAFLRGHASAIAAFLDDAESGCLELS